jgi:hypothetical protein
MWVHSVVIYEHADQDEAIRDLCWYKFKLLSTLSKGSRTYNKHYEQTPRVRHAVNNP